MNDLAQIGRWRSQLVQGAAIWSQRGRHTVLDGRCLALSGTPSTDGNVIFCFGGDLPAPVRRSAIDVRESVVPVVILLAAEALGWAQVLADCDLVCVGASPFMQLSVDRIERGVVDPGIRRLRPEDLVAARGVVAEAYARGSSMADIALPDEAVGSRDWGLWGLEVDGALVSVVTTSRVDDATSVWSMSTPARSQRRGYGRRLLRSVLSEVADGGAADVLLYCSPSGAALYRSLGFEVVEYWQQWSRPRWVLGRT